MKLRAAILQTMVSAEKEKNIRRVGELLAAGAAKGADLVTLPEMFACPYDTANFPAYAEPEGGPTWQALSDLARKYGIWLCAGSVPELEHGSGNQPPRVYNTAWVFDREGSQAGKHRKAHLFDIDVSGGQYFRESDTLSPGDRIGCFDSEFGKIGLCICYDFRFPETARLMALDGARLILVPAAFNMTTGPAHWELMFRQRAVESQCYVIGTAPARDAGAGYVSYGHSIAVDPWGRVLVQMDEKEGAAVVDLDLDYADRVREELPLLRHRRTDLYELTRI